MTDISAAEREAYDSVAYPTAIIAHMTPDRIAAAGRLYGWRAPDPTTASVLEIGCGDGLNIIGMAAVAPLARHAGFDLSEPAIARGQALVKAAGLTNVTLEAGDILEWPRTGECFDYIVCHGVYAWVPEPVQQALLELIGARLAPGGVAYVSFDALPAAASKLEIQRFLVRRTAGIKGMQARVEAAAKILATLARHQVEGSRLKPQLDSLAKTIASFDDAYFFHDWLAGHYAPPLLSDFAAAAASSGLKVAGEAGLTDLFTRDLDDEARALAGDESDMALRGESLDFLRGAQMFRRCYLVRKDAPPTPAEGLDGLYFSFEGDRAEELDETTGESRFRYNVDVSTFLIPTTDGQRSLMDALWQAPSGELSYADAVAAAGDAEAADAALRRVCTLGLVAAHATRPCFTLQPGERPLTAPLLRAMFASGDSAITLRHARLVPKEPPTARFLTLCDGTRDRVELAAEMSNALSTEITPDAIGAAIADLAGRRIFLA